MSGLTSTSMLYISLLISLILSQQHHEMHKCERNNKTDKTKYIKSTHMPKHQQYKYLIRLVTMFAKKTTKFTEISIKYIRVL